MKIQLWLEVSSIEENKDPYLEGPTFETSKATLAKDCREQALKTWTREQIRLGNLTYNDLTNHTYSCLIHDEAFSEFYGFAISRSSLINTIKL